MDTRLHISLEMQQINQTDLPAKTLPFFALPAEMRRLVYHYLRSPCWYLLDRSHPKAKLYAGLERMPTYSEPFTIPDWTFTLGIKRQDTLGTSSVSVRAQLALAATCKRLHCEILGDLYSTYTFLILNETEKLEKVNSFFETIGPANRSCLRHIEVQVFSPTRKHTCTRLLSNLAAGNFTRASGFVPQHTTYPSAFQVAIAPPWAQRGTTSEESNPKLQVTPMLNTLMNYHNNLHADLQIKLQLTPCRFSTKICFWDTPTKAWKAIDLF